ncbi:MAG: J domain-containing protein [Bacillota bacterium]|nr:J domain-containing protein [Bacillota bacterium]MDP4170212.1 J domain-containing protein [Bacillota bacterium]
MLNVNEVTRKLRSEGIADSEQIVTRWIREGKLKATKIKHFKIDYSINPDDLAVFISKKKIEGTEKAFEIDYKQWKKTFDENQKLKEEIEELKSTMRIEQAKVRSLKKMLKAEYALSESPPITLISLLGLDADADEQLVKKEFKKILKSLHPDRGGDERLFKVFNEHYQKTK